MEPEKKDSNPIFVSGLIEEIGSFLTKARFYLSLPYTTVSNQATKGEVRGDVLTSLTKYFSGFD